MYIGNNFGDRWLKTHIQHQVRLIIWAFMRRVCALCGHRHHAAEACPCPRCAFQHADSDCLAVEQWQYHISDGSFKLFVGCYCIICGHVHDIEGDCPSDHDHCYYARCDRLSEIGLCAFCNVRHDETCVCYIASCCCFCGEVHDASTPCPCPLCLRLHVGGECSASLARCAICNRIHEGICVGSVVGCCLLCGERHNVTQSCPSPQYEDPSAALSGPCCRCHIWHGADVCFHRNEQSFTPSRLRLPRAQMRNRAAANIEDHSLLEVAAPVHNDDVSDVHNVGTMSTACTHCGARFWAGESIICCSEGSLDIPEPDIPISLSNLILSAAVRRNFRAYNMAMAMASVGHQKSGFPDGVFVMSGKSYHRIGTLVPNDGQRASFAQIYTLDTISATNRRVEVFGDSVDPSVLSALHDAMLLHNSYVSEFVRAVASNLHELVWSSDDNIMGMQIGALVSNVGNKRLIVFQRHGQANSPFAQDLEFIDDGHALYHTLVYPLLFPTGSRGWYWGMTRRDRSGNVLRPVSLHDYGRYMLMHRLQ